MRKVVKPVIRCDKCGLVIKHEEYEEFCDFCEKQTSPNFPLEITLFPHGAEDAYHANLCSWKCVKNYLIKYKKKILKYNFITMPYLSFGNKKEKQDYVEKGESFYQEFLKDE